MVVMVKTMAPPCAFLLLLLTATSSAERSLRIKRAGRGCSELPAGIHNGNISCTVESFYLTCVATCFTGFEFEDKSPSPIEHQCDIFGNSWISGPEVPNCVKDDQTTGNQIGRKRDVYGATPESDCFDARPDCDEHGEIMMCTAHEVWAWDNCQKYCGFCAICASLCQNGGTCDTPNHCVCPPDYTGISCEIPVCASPCQNGGICDAPNHCDCAPGYTGNQCETPKFP